MAKSDITHQSLGSVLLIAVFFQLPGVKLFGIDHHCGVQYGYGAVRVKKFSPRHVNLGI